MDAATALAGLPMVRRLYKPLLSRNPRHGTTLKVWFALYVFAGLQLAWVFRLFLQYPGRPVRFFSENAWANPYEMLVEGLMAFFGL